MQEKLFDILNVVALILVSIVFVIILTGCSNKQIVKKEIVEKKIYIKSKCPKLKLYDYNKSLILNAYNEDNKICIVDWNVCIDRDKFVELLTHIKMLKKSNQLYKEEIIKYNNFVEKH